MNIHHKVTWYTQTFLCRLLCGHKKKLILPLRLVTRSVAKSRFIKYMIWKEVKAFGNVLVTVGFIARIPKVTLKCLWNFSFQLPIISISCIWVETSTRSFLVTTRIENSLPIRNYNKHFTFKKSLEKFCRNFISYIGKSF